MMHWRIITLVSVLALSLPNAHAALLPISSGGFEIAAASNGSSYTEVGDAGDRFAPQDVTGSGINRITGTIGDADGVDAFRFFFAGGSIEFAGQVIIDDVASPLALSLFAAPPSGPGGPIPIPYPNLLPGNYILEVAIDTIDPPFTITIVDPATGGSQTVSAPIPEPATVALFGLGLAGLVAVRQAASRRRPPASGPRRAQ
jgi:hypothetical protein